METSFILKALLLIAIYSLFLLNNSFPQTKYTDELRENLFPAMMANKLNINQNYKAGLIFDIANHIYRQYPNFPPSQFHTLVNQIDKVYDLAPGLNVESFGYYNRREQREKLLVGIKMFGDASSGGFAGSLFVNIMEDYNLSTYDYSSYSQYLQDTKIDEPFGIELRFIDQGYNQFSPNDDLIKIGEQMSDNWSNNYFREAILPYTSKYIDNINPKTDILSLPNEVFPLDFKIKRLEELMSKSASRRELKDGLHELASELNASLNNKLKEIDSIYYLKINQLTKYQNQQRLKHISRDRRSKEKHIIEGYRSGTYLLSTAFSILGDEKMSHYTNVIGNSLLNTYDAISKYKFDVKEYGNSWENDIILSANLVSIGLSLVTTFIEKGPTADQLILDQLSNIQKQLNQIREEMHTRFDRIDLKLYQLHSDLASRLLLINKDILNNSSQLRDVQNQLMQLRNQLYRTEYNITNLLIRIQDSEYSRTMENCYYQGNDLTDKEFLECLNFAKHYGANNASTNYLGKKYDAQNFELENVPFEIKTHDYQYDLNYFLEYITRSSKINLFTDIPSQNSWLSGSSWYLVIANENLDKYEKLIHTKGDLGRQIEADHLKSLITTGEAIKRGQLQLIDSIYGVREEVLEIINRNYEIEKDEIIYKINEIEDSYIRDMKDRNNMQYELLFVRHDTMLLNTLKFKSGVHKMKKSITRIEKDKLFFESIDPEPLPIEYPDIEDNVIDSYYEMPTKGNIYKVYTDHSFEIDSNSFEKFYEKHPYQSFIKKRYDLGKGSLIHNYDVYIESMEDYPTYENLSVNSSNGIFKAAAEYVFGIDTLKLFKGISKINNFIVIGKTTTYWEFFRGVPSNGIPKSKISHFQLDGHNPIYNDSIYYLSIDRAYPGQGYGFGNFNDLLNNISITSEWTSKHAIINEWNTVGFPEEYHFDFPTFSVQKLFYDENYKNNSFIEYNSNYDDFTSKKDYLTFLCDVFDNSTLARVEWWTKLVESIDGIGHYKISNELSGAKEMLKAYYHLAIPNLSSFNNEIFMNLHGSKGLFDQEVLIYNINNAIENGTKLHELRENFHDGEVNISMDSVKSYFNYLDSISTKDDFLIFQYECFEDINDFAFWIDIDIEYAANSRLKKYLETTSKFIASIDSIEVSYSQVDNMLNALYYFRDFTRKHKVKDLIDQYLINSDHVNNINLSALKLQTLPKEIKEFNNIDTLDLSFNNLVRFSSEEVGSAMFGLRFLNLKGNQLAKWELCKDCHIDYIDISYNNLTSLSKNTLKNKKIDTIDARFNNFREKEKKKIRRKFDGEILF